MKAVLREYVGNLQRERKLVRRRIIGDLVAVHLLAFMGFVLLVIAAIPAAGPEDFSRELLAQKEEQVSMLWKIGSGIVGAQTMAIIFLYKDLANEKRLRTEEVRNVGRMREKLIEAISRLPHDRVAALETLAEEGGEGGWGVSGAGAPGDSGSSAATEPRATRARSRPEGMTDAFL